MFTPLIDFLKNKTSVHLSGWDNNVLKELFFLRFGETSNKKFILNAKVSQKQTKRSVDKSQVAKKIDYKITIDYALSDTKKNCSDISNRQTTSFSFTPKSSGYNFASDVLFNNLLRESILDNINNFISYANYQLQLENCLNEG